MIDPELFGKQMGAIVREAQAPLLKRLEALESRAPVDGKDGASLSPDDVAPMLKSLVESAVADIPKPRDGVDGTAGEKGADGRDGKDADPIMLPDVAKELLAMPELKALVSLLVAEGVAEYVKANPPRDGADGKDGAPGRDGGRGEKGEDGKSVALDDVSLFLDAAIAKHALDLERRGTDAINKAIEKIPTPKDGRDGRDLTDLDFELDGRSLKIKSKGETVKSYVLPIPMDAGYYRDGMKCAQGDIVTHDGNAWIALKETAERPSFAAKDVWRMFARKGKDGDSAKDAPAPEPVKLK